MATPQSAQPQQTPVSYEVSLWGEINGDTDSINPIINRFTLNTEITQKLHIRDIIFEPSEEAAPNEPIYLRCRCDMAKPNWPWSLLTYGRPQSERISPDAVVRPVALMQVSAGNVMAFASALGYRVRSDIVKEGHLFIKGSLTIHMFRAPQKAKDTEVIDVDAEPGSNQTWNVDIRQYPVVSVKDTTITEAIDNVLMFKLLMKGLLDLERKDVA